MPHITPGHAIQAPEFSGELLSMRMVVAFSRALKNMPRPQVAVGDMASAQSRVRVTDNIVKQGRARRKTRRK